MFNCNHLKLLFTLLIALSLPFSSCNDSNLVPFPTNDLGYSTPVTTALEFTPSRQLKWDTVKQGGIKPLFKKLDVRALPALPYDTNSFHAFAKPPGVTRFDWLGLKDTFININALPSNPIHFKVSVLSPSSVKVVAPAAQKGKAHAIFDFGTMQGFQPKFITSLLKDKNGLLWIGSNEGLYRYDGTHLQTFLSGLKSGVVDIIEDKNGLLWYIQAGEGFGMIDPLKGILKTTNRIGNVTNNVTQMTIDNNGKIWAYNVMDSAVCIIDPKTESYKKLGRESGLSDDKPFAIMHDNAGLTWITTNSGVNIIDHAAGKIKYLRKKEGLSSDSVSAITQDKSGQVWVATSSGMDAIDLKFGTIKHFGALQGMGGKFVFDSKIDDKGNVWMGTNKGIQILDPHNGTKFLNQNKGIAGNVVLALMQDNLKRMWVATTTGLNVIGQNAETVHQLNSNVIVTMLEDDEGNVWIGTDAGIYIVDYRKNIYRLLKTSNGLGNDFIQNFTRFNKKMLVSTDGGIDIIDTHSKTIEHIGKKEGLVNDTIYAAFRDKAGNIWLTGPSNGIDIIDAANKRLYHTEMSGGLNDNNIQDIKEDNNGFIWLATNKGGINVYDPVSRTVRYLNNQPGLRGLGTKMMLKDSYGRIWIGTNKGIYVADSRQGTITAITKQNGLPSNHILSLLEYKGNVIVGTNSKAGIITIPPPVYAADISRAPKQSWKISMLKNADDLVREQTGSWSTDAVTSTGQYLWGDRGLTVVNEIKPETDSVPTFITGMNVMTEPQHFLDKMEVGEKDTLWTADTFYTNTDNVKLLTAYERKFKWNSVTGPFNLPVDLHLPYDQNYIQFQFTQAHLSRPDSIWYTYVLEGIDKKWSTPSINTFTENYLNLPPGNYTFKVASKGISGQWSQPAIFSFTIAPPWYKTWWTFIVVAILAVSILRGYIVFRSRRLQRENKLLEEKIALRTGELQKSLEDLKATQMQLIQSEKMASLGELTAGIAHEIQNPLNFVNNFSEVNKELIEEMELEMEKGNMDEVKAIANDIKENEIKISQHGKRADAIVKGMLLHSRTNNGKKELTNINDLAEEYLRLSYHGLRAKDKSFNADYKTDFEKNLGKVNVVPQDMGRVLLNLYNNAFYSVHQKKQKLNGSFQPTVSVTTKQIDNKVEIVVKDNGFGVPQKELGKIFQPFFTTKPTGEGTGLGLSLSYDIVKSNGGELNVVTAEGEFAEFKIVLPV